MIGAAIGAAGSLASGVVNAIGNNRQGSKNREHQLQMQAIQNEWASSESQKPRDVAAYQAAELAKQQQQQQEQSSNQSAQSSSE